MATAARTTPELISLDEYLHTSYRPDVEFVDGHLEERSLGSTKHSELQIEIGLWFRQRKHEWKVRVRGDVRVVVSSTRVRLPDVAVVPLNDLPDDDAQRTVPIIAIEILSPDDRIERVKIRLRDFLAMGVPNVWIIDPITRAGMTFSTEGLMPAPAGRLTVPNSPIYLDLPELFAGLDA